MGTFFFWTFEGDTAFQFQTHANEPGRWLIWLPACDGFAPQSQAIQLKRFAANKLENSRKRNSLESFGGAAYPKENERKQKQEPEKPEVLRKSVTSKTAIHL